MARRLAFAATVLASLFATVPVVRAQENHDVFRVGNWIGVEYVNPSGAVDRCSAVAQYGNDFVLSLTMWANGHVGLKVTNESWPLDKREYDMAIMIDRTYLGTMPFNPESRFKLGVDLGYSPIVANFLATGRHLYLRSNEFGLYDFPLVGSASAMAMLRSCVAGQSFGPIVEPRGQTTVVLNVEHAPPVSLPPFQDIKVDPSRQKLLNLERNPCAFGVAALGAAGASPCTTQ